MEIAAAILTGILGFAGSLIGARLALSRFKSERAFDKCLDWYERAIRSLSELAEAIEIAGTFQNEKGASADVLSDAWVDVQSAHLALDRLDIEAGLFGSPKAAREFNKVTRLVQKVANASEAFDPPKIGARQRDDVLSDVYGLPEKLASASKALVAEARVQLGLESSPRIMFRSLASRR